ncbi:MAG: 2-phospho-L-lactate guanylyltransferase [Betaproteobacteria bacterium]|jgi:2-phospho-L-lactate guanylyltransferase|nr:2-phospho-L-lactate guanylyltransferase [Betaproteobacteria bacterium]
MQAWTIVPIRGLATGKTRLAPALDAAERMQLCTRMLCNTLDAVEATFGGLDRCIVVSGDAAARTIAAQRGARTLADPEGAGLDGALDAARAAACIEGATRLLVLSADMPDLDHAALQALLQSAGSAQPVLLADKCGTGTNGMLVPADLPLSFAFGPDSLRRHRAALAGMGIAATCWDDPRLAFDIDTPADLDAWRAATAAMHPLRAG